MINARLYDGGTELTTVDEGVPGMARAVWLQSDFEDDAFHNRQAEIDELFRSVTNKEVQPWPEDMPGAMWVDNFGSYSNNDDGLNFQIYYHDQINDDYPKIPGGRARFIEDPDEFVRRGDARLMRVLSWRETQKSGNVDTPTDYLRLDSKNEAYGTRLGPGLAMQIIGHRGASVVLELEDNTLFAPFDLTDPSKFRVFKDGSDTAMPDNEARGWLRLHDNGVYRLYLRPRRWRWYAFIRAYYLYITPFDLAVVERHFIRQWFDRPPVYPYRHEILNGGTEDYGVSWQFEHSRAAAALRSEIIAAQWWTLCQAFVYFKNDPAELTLWRVPESQDDFLLGIERYDRATGATSRVWVMAAESQTAKYPTTQIAQLEAPFYVTGADD